MDRIILTNPVEEHLPQTWSCKLRRKIIAQNHQVRLSKKEQVKCDGERLWRAMSKSKQGVLQTYNAISAESKQGPYSQYINIGTNMHTPNELTLCFPYLRYLDQKSKNIYHKELRQISLKLTDREDYDAWNGVCRDYAPCLDVSQLVYLLFRLLNEGTGILPDLAEKYRCKSMTLLFMLLSIKQFFYKNSNMFPFTISLARNDKISLQNVSKSMKLLFCSQCLIYDCQKHVNSDLVQQHEYQYIPRHNAHAKVEERKDNILENYSHLAIIYGKNHEQEQEEYMQQYQQQICCKDGAECFKKLTRNKWQNLVESKTKKTYSPIFMIHLKIGIQLYQYNPCKIATLFPPQQSASIHCNEIFYYLINCSSILNELQHKFHSSQKLYLQQQASGKMPLPKPKKKAKAKTKDTRGRNHHNRQIFNGVCFHYFIDGVQQDVDCTNCQCQQRGYCLPQCQCGQNCPIPFKGCKCKGNNRCMQNCLCLKQKRSCHPLRCFNCFKDKDGQLCKNNEQEYQKKKITRVGPSLIKQAGLGLFAGQFIQKGSYVMQYLGEVLQDTNIQQIRENLCVESIFYNFEISSGKSMDSRLFGNKSRFINHSNKRANLQSIKMRINEEDVIIYRAERDIKEGEELLFHYDPSGKLRKLKEKYPFMDE